MFYNSETQFTKTGHDETGTLKMGTLSENGEKYILKLVTLSEHGEKGTSKLVTLIKQ